MLIAHLESRWSRLVGFAVAAFSLALASALHAAAQPDIPLPEAARAAFLRSKVGFFVHYVWPGGPGLTCRPDGSPPKSFDALAQGFDVPRFVNDIASWETEYLIFTAWHANINPLFPSETMRKWGLASHVCPRDLLRELIDACKARGIAVVLYTHPRDGHDLRGEDRIRTGWGAGKGAHGGDPDWSQFDYAKWNDFTNDLYAELVERYGRDIVGLFLDEGSSAGDSHRVVDYPRLRRTIKSRAPHLVLLQNDYGTRYSCDVGVKEYHHWQQFENRDGGAWPAWDIPVAAPFATTWWAARSTNHPRTVVYSAEDMFRYTVLQAGANTLGGGMQWAAGPYVGGGWEPGVEETLRQFAAYLKPVASSIRGTVASAAFPTQKGAALKNIGWGVRAVDWGVATDAPDGSVTYLHVLNPPRSKRLRIGMPYNGKRFSKASTFPGGDPVALDLDSAGYVLTLSDSLDWNPVHTAIRLEAR